MDKLPETDELDAVRRWVPPGSVVIEGGSGQQGDVTEALIALGCRVVAVDPLGPVHPAITFPAGAGFVGITGALGTTDGDGAYVVSSEWWANTTLATPRYGEVVETVAVRVYATTGLIREHGATALVLDVEGSEWDILWDLSWFASPLRVVVAELHEKIVDGAFAWRVLTRMARAGFAVRELTHKPTGDWIAAWGRDDG